MKICYDSFIFSLDDVENPSHAFFFNGNTSVEMRNDFNVEIIKVNDEVKFKVVIPHPSRFIKVIGKYLKITSLFFITRSKMFLTFCAL